jgi:hypothetical protein
LREWRKFKSIVIRRARSSEFKIPEPFVSFVSFVVNKTN